MAGQFPARRWAFWRWQECRNPGGVVCLRRLTIFRCPAFSVMLHWIYEAEPEGWYHTHGWRFWSFILGGWYVEDVDRRGRIWRTWFNYKSPKTMHRVAQVAPDGCLTLVIAGPWRHLVLCTGR